MTSRAQVHPGSMVLDDEEDEKEHKWTPVDARSLDHASASERGGQVKTFLDSASTTTTIRSGSVSSSLPSAFLLSRSSSSTETEKTPPKASSTRSNPKLTLKAQAQAQARVSSHSRAAAHVRFDTASSKVDSTDESFAGGAASSIAESFEPSRRIPPTLLLSPSVSSLGSYDQFEHFRLQHSELGPEVRRDRHRVPPEDGDEEQWSKSPQLQPLDQPLPPKQWSFSPPSPPAAEPFPLSFSRLGTTAQDMGFIRPMSDDAPTDRTVPSTIMTREEFEALPPTIQRKYFSTLERLRFAQDSCLSYYTQPYNGLEHSRQTSQEFTAPPSTAEAAPRISSTDLRFYANLPDKIRRRHLSEEEQLVVQRHRQSVMLDAADEAVIKIGMNQTPNANLDDYPFSLVESEHQEPWVVNPTGDLRSTRDMESLYESFRWLDEDEDLDLSLYLDDYHINLRQEVPLPSTHHRPTFRRRLSVSKLPFGRSSVSYGRPGTDTSNNAIPTRRKSKALSMISPNKQAMPDALAAIDPYAAHYQDPEARMKLRVYLASPQKFDEAIEFGFPSVDQAQAANEKPGSRAASRQQGTKADDKLCTFLDDDDDRSLDNSDMATTPEPDSPRTPDVMDRPTLMRLGRANTDLSARYTPNPSVRGDYAHAPASSREMTLRMTLTRPDLRAHEDQIYGWQNDVPAWRGSNRDALASSHSYRDGLTKRSVERQFAAMDSESESPVSNHEQGAVKRFWHRVCR